MDCAQKHVAQLLPYVIGLHSQTAGAENMAEEPYTPPQSWYQQ
jgi:hypothetical protein